MDVVVLVIVLLVVGAILSLSLVDVVPPQPAPRRRLGLPSLDIPENRRL